MIADNIYIKWQDFFNTRNPLKGPITLAEEEVQELLSDIQGSYTLNLVLQQVDSICNTPSLHIDSKLYGIGMIIRDNITEFRPELYPDRYTLNAIK